MNFNGILIGSEDPQRLTDYYRKLFGEPGWDDGGYTGWQIGSGGISIGPHSEVHGKNAAPAGSSGTSRATTCRATSIDSRPPAPPSSASRTASSRRPDAWIATFADPDDNYFQLITPFDPNTMGSGG